MINDERRLSMVPIHASVTDMLPVRSRVETRLRRGHEERFRALAISCGRRCGTNECTKLLPRQEVGPCIIITRKDAFFPQ